MKSSNKGSVTRSSSVEGLREQSIRGIPSESAKPMQSHNIANSNKGSIKESRSCKHSMPTMGSKQSFASDAPHTEKPLKMPTKAEMGKTTRI